MKTLNLYALMFVAVLFAFSSCNKDSEEQPRPTDLDNIVGTWNVSSADAVAYIEGVAYPDIEVTTDGTMQFNEDGTGAVDFTMTYLEGTNELKGSLDWERDGFEIIMSINGGTALPYANVTNEFNYQELQVTYKDNASNDEVEFTFKLERLN